MSVHDPDLEASTVAVKVVEPVDARIAPTESGAAFSEDLTTDATRILQHHPNRRRALLYPPAAGDIIFSFGRSQVQAGNGFVLRGGSPPVEITCINEVYAKAVTGVVTISILDEYWVEVD